MPKDLSRLGLRTALISFGAAVVLSFVHGYLVLKAREITGDGYYLDMLVTWCADFRYLFEQLILAGVILFAGAKLLETRSVFTVGFDKVDAAKVRVKGPDEENIVWIGHRYGSRLEAETVAEAFSSRLNGSMGSE